MTSSTGFSDHFSGVAAGYAAHRPSYPDALFDALAPLAPTRDVAWDCAAGNGQASVALGDRFARVIATDASASQIANAAPHSHVRYSVAPAERSGIASSTVSLLTVAQALHWFKVPAFYAEARRVLVPNGVLAVWCYGLMRVPDNPDLEALIEDFSDRRLHGWWPHERRHVDVGYRDLPFPFERIAVGTFAMGVDWTLTQLEGYMRTWSPVTRLREAKGYDPVALLLPELTAAWGGKELRHLSWPLTMLVGRANVTR